MALVPLTIKASQAPVVKGGSYVPGWGYHGIDWVWDDETPPTPAQKKSRRAAMKAKGQDPTKPPAKKKAATPLQQHQARRRKEAAKLRERDRKDRAVTRREYTKANMDAQRASTAANMNKDKQHYEEAVEAHRTAAEAATSESRRKYHIDRADKYGDLLDKLIYGDSPRAKKTPGKKPTARKTPAKKTAARSIRSQSSSLRDWRNEPTAESKLTDEEVDAKYNKLQEKRKAGKRLTAAEQEQLGDLSIERQKRYAAKKTSAPKSSAYTPKTLASEQVLEFTARVGDRQRSYSDALAEKNGMDKDQLFRAFQAAARAEGKATKGKVAQEQEAAKKYILPKGTTPRRGMKVAVKNSDGSLSVIRVESVRNGRVYGPSVGGGERIYAEGLDPVTKRDDDWSMDVPIVKVDTEQRLAFGWLQVAEKTDGTLVLDKQGDEVTVEELEKAAYDYVITSRDGGDMHIRKGVAVLVESMMFTEEKIEKMGLPRGSLPLGWWGGYKVIDDDLWDDVKSGRRKMFSVGGTGRRTPVEE